MALLVRNVDASPFAVAQNERNAWLVDRKITPHIPVWDKSMRSDGTFSRADFVFDRERKVYICTGGSVLTGTGNIDQGHTIYYLASKNTTAEQCTN